MQAVTQVTQAEAPQPLSNKLEIEKFSDAHITCLRFSGVINEQFEGKKLASSLKAKTLVIDLANVHRISSFGIREWTAFIQVADRAADNVYLIGCTPKVMNQLNMVANFAGKAMVFSFYAPYRCDYCETNRSLLMNMDRDEEAIRKMKPPEVPCPTCGNPEYFDEDPAGFFSFVAQQKKFSIDADVATFLISKLNYPVSDLARRVQAEKFIDGHYTYVRLIGNLDSSFPREKIAEGLEGVVVLDVSGIGGMDPAGAAEFRRFLSQVTPMVERVSLMGCQPVLMERGIRPEDLNPKIHVVSFSVPYACAKCNTTALQEIDVPAHYEVLKIAMPPQMKCTDCGGATQCAASGSVLSNLTSLPKPVFEPEIKKFIKKALKHQKQAAAKSVQAEGQMAPAGTWSRLALPTVAVGVLAIGAIVGLGYYQQQQAQKMVQNTVASINTTAAKKRPAWITSDTPFGGYCTDLTTRTVCVGVSSYLPDRDQARAEAMATAMDALASAIGLGIDTAEFSGLRRDYDDARRKALAEVEEAQSGPKIRLEELRARVRESRRMVSAALQRSGGPGVPSQVADWYWEQYDAEGGGSEYLVFVRFDIANEAMKTLVTAYGVAADVSGSKVLTSFPSMAWKRLELAEGVTVMGAVGPIAELGVADKDAILLVRDQPVRDAADFALRFGAELAARPQNGGKVKLSLVKPDGTRLDLERAVK